MNNLFLQQTSFPSLFAFGLMPSDVLRLWRWLVADQQNLGSIVADNRQRGVWVVHFAWDCRRHVDGSGVFSEMLNTTKGWRDKRES